MSVTNINTARLRTGMLKALDTMETLTKLVSCPASKARLAAKAQATREKIKNLETKPCA